MEAWEESTMQDIQVTLAKNLKAKPQDESKLGFGKIFTDHMFLMNYEQGKGWINPRVCLLYTSAACSSVSSTFMFAGASTRSMAS